MQGERVAGPEGTFEESTWEPHQDDEFAMPGHHTKRIARQRAARHRRLLFDGTNDLLRLIEVAIRQATTLNLHPEHLRAYRDALMERRQVFGADLGVTIQPRQAPAPQLPLQQQRLRPRNLVFIDECGHHTHHDHHFPYFSVAAVLIAERDYPSIRRRWRAWRRWLTDPTRATHEPRMRTKDLRYILLPGRSVERAQASLGRLLMALPFYLVAAVLDHRAFVQQYQGQPVDEFLPRDSYLMCFTFVLERIVHLLYHGLGDQVATVIADQRGAREDALLQREFQRLKVEGTLFYKESWFRYCLGPHIRFLSRDHDEVGLQIADLLARPVAEKYADPKSSPLRWEVARAKLYWGNEGTRPAYGLKLFPSDHERLAAMLGA